MRSDRSTSDLALLIPAKADNVAIVRELLRGLERPVLRQPGLADEVLTAVSEAANNVVAHAYRDGTGLMEVELFLGPRLEIHVRDWGRGPERWGDGDTDQLGLQVMRAFTDHLELRAVGDRWRVDEQLDFESESPGCDQTKSNARRDC